MKERFESIQILRAIAALSVVFYHSWIVIDWFPDDYKITIPFIYKYGYLGVDLFFIISGFIIAHVLSGGSVTAGQFLWKRFFRIYPLYWTISGIGILITLVIGLSMGGSEPVSAQYLIRSALILPMQGAPFLAVGWSLEHEIVFYLVCSTAIFLNKGNAIPVALLVMGVAGIVYEHLQRTLALPFEYHLISPTNIMFLVGVLIYRNKARFSKYNCMPFYVVSAVLMIAGIEVLSSNGNLSKLVGHRMLICLSLAAFVMAAIATKPMNNRYFLLTISKKSLVAIGNASFSLYLIHMVIFRLLSLSKVKAYVGLPNYAAEVWRFGSVALAIVLSLLIYRMLEKPLIKAGESLWNRLTKSSVAALPIIR